jgi:calcium-dependent protein kinase
VYKCIQRDPLAFGPGWNNISAAARELVAGLLEKDPYKRYTIEQALAHRWVAGDAAVDRPLDRSLISHLMTFNAKNRFKKEAMRLVASTLSAKDVAGLREAFNKIDTDHSGVITQVRRS